MTCGGDRSVCLFFFHSLAG